MTPAEQVTDKQFERYALEVLNENSVRTDLPASSVTTWSARDCATFPHNRSMSEVMSERKPFLQLTLSPRASMANFESWMRTWPDCRKVSRVRRRGERIGSETP
jgi:hypothetical protein